jgi:hypothetical protein
LPTDLAGEMKSWPEFQSGEGYSVELKDPFTGEEVSLRRVTESPDYLEIRSNATGPLFDRAVGRAVYLLAGHSDNLMINRLDHG